MLHPQERYTRTGRNSLATGAGGYNLTSAEARRIAPTGR
jgi:hypothetical protein